MLAYLGQSVGKRAAIDLGKTLAEALPSLLAAVPRHVRHAATFPDDKLVISADRQQIIQVLSNLVINAGEAIGDQAGTIEVTLGQVPKAQLPKPQFPMIDWQPKAASYACLAVGDNGRGMAPEIQEKAFDPFFTTKFVGRGLGLPVVLGTVRAYEGLITVESRRPLGTTVRVFLPLLPPPLKKIEKIQVTTKTRPVTSRNLVLLAEDEEPLRRATQRMFGRMGYEAVTAVDGVDALVRFRQNFDDIGLAMIDLSMPRMDGWTTLKAIHELRPNLPVILVSGYDEQLALREHAPEPNLVFLHKPFTLADLQNAIRNASA
jgi:CheY-like chemotaxis protein